MPEINEEEFHAFRRQGIGGSDVAAILGKSPYRTALDVWNEKVLDYQPSFPKIVGDAMQQGKELEKYIINECALTYANIKKPEKGDYSVVFPGNPIFRGNLDFSWKSAWGYRDDGEPRFEAFPISFIEAKTESIKNIDKYGDTKSFDIPVHYQLQVKHYAYILSLKYPQCVNINAYIPIWFVDRQVYFKEGTHQIVEKRTYEYIFSEKEKKEMEEISKELIKFWNEYVITKIPPSLYYPRTFQPVDYRDLGVLANIKDIRAKKKELAAQEKELLSYLDKKYDNDVLVNPEDKNEVMATRTHVNSRRLDMKSLKEDSSVDLEGHYKDISYSTWKIQENT